MYGIGQVKQLSTYRLPFKLESDASECDQAGAFVKAVVAHTAVPLSFILT